MLIQLKWQSRHRRLTETICLGVPLGRNTHKAGTEGFDTEKINEIIKKASEGSRFYQHKQKWQQRLDAKLLEMKRAAEAFSEEQIQKATLLVGALHTYDTLNEPMVVKSTRMLSTSNYATRRLCIRAAMPGFIDKELCFELVFAKPDFTKFKQASKEIQEIFSQ
ncbi:DNA polymerase kappa-like [Penaeus indicus]|uniref:DNA polymerase kappa-like n=1 Tax=Penaeus indicus TaxID=29960 RepID=UPI00300CED23